MCLYLHSISGKKDNLFNIYIMYIADCNVIVVLIRFLSVTGRNIHISCRSFDHFNYVAHKISSL